MATNLLGSSALLLAEAESVDLKSQIHPVPRPRRLETKYKWDIVWRNVVAMIYLHTFSFYGLYLLIFACQWKTFIWTCLLVVVVGQGITAGAHRLWAHRCYKANFPLRLLLAFGQTMAFQNHIYEWVRDHRVHHKFTDTDADPHNAKRGFFFSHVGWLLVRKHKDIFEKGRTVDMSDLLEDPIVRFQKKYYAVLMPLCCFALPTLVPYYLWNESLHLSWYVCSVLRYTLTLNGTWLVNSAAHIYGSKPYDRNIGPTENRFVSAMAFGEGWHNYHHVFPWDYKASELGYRINLTTRVIDGFARIGWAWDLKTVSLDVIEKRAGRTGDGSRCSKLEGVEELSGGISGGIWGWGDGDMTEEDFEAAEIFHRVD